MSMDTTLPPHGMADPKSASGKFPAPEQMVDVLVVGAGPAGLAAALEAARSGASVLLVDEHPVPVGLAGLDVPYLFGGRAGTALANPARMVERIAAATPGLAEAYDAGVEVLLGVSAWGAWVERPGLAVLPCSLAGLSDGSRSWMCGFRRLVVAAGARDLVLSFRDADQPGVMGARGLA
ncbi:FAD-dependent oxidoreductase, partial [Acidiphilium sp. PM]